MQLSSQLRIDHLSASAIDLPQFSFNAVSLLVPGASSCSSFGCCSSCSTAAIGSQAVQS